MKKWESSKDQKEKQDYRNYRLSRFELCFGVGATAVLSLVVSLLFYGTPLLTFPLLGFLPLTLKILKSFLADNRKRKITLQFTDGMKAYGIALRAGFSPESGIKEAVRDLEGIYGSKALVVMEFKQIYRRLSLGETIENELVDLGERTGLREARDMGEVFAIAKRGGGSLPEVIGQWVRMLEEKSRIEREIQTLITGKKLEQRLMYLMPGGILLYVNLTSPDFLDTLYQGLLGRGLMTGFLALNGLAIYMGEKLMKVRI